MSQYTLRAVPADLDRAIRKRAAETGTSVNQASLDLLRHGLEQTRLYHDLDFVSGSWVSDGDQDRAFDDAFDATLKEQRQIDSSLWGDHKPTAT